LAFPPSAVLRLAAPISSVSVRADLGYSLDAPRIKSRHMPRFVSTRRLPAWRIGLPYLSLRFGFLVFNRKSVIGISTVRRFAIGRADFQCAAFLALRIFPRNARGPSAAPALRLVDLPTAPASRKSPPRRIYPRRLISLATRHQSRHVKSAIGRTALRRIYTRRVSNRGTFRDLYPRAASRLMTRRAIPGTSHNAPPVRKNGACLSTSAALLSCPDYS